jgi:hypothetical protein
MSLDCTKFASRDTSMRDGPSADVHDCLVARGGTYDLEHVHAS